MDNFHIYLKKQLLEYVEAERQKGIPLEEIEKTLIDSGHHKNIIDEVFIELEKSKPTTHKTEVESDLISQLKNAFSQFMARASNKEVKDAKEDFKKTDTDKIVKEVIQEAEIIEEKTMFESLTFFVYLVALGIIVLLSASGSDSNFVSVFIGFSPAILSIFISFLALPLADNVPIYVFIPVIMASVFYGLGKFSGLSMFAPLDIDTLAVVNFLFAFFFNILIVYVRFLKPRSMKRKIIKPRISQKVSKNNLLRREIRDLKEEFKI